MFQVLPPVLISFNLIYHIYIYKVLLASVTLRSSTIRVVRYQYEKTLIQSIDITYSLVVSGIAV